MTYKELKEYVANNKKAKAIEWKKEIAIHGHCKPFTDKEYKQNKDLIFTGKKSHTNKIASTKLWQTY